MSLGQGLDGGISGAHAPSLADVRPQDPADIDRLVDLWGQAVEPGWATGAYLGSGGWLAWVGAAEHARRLGRDPPRLVSWLWRRGEWDHVTQGDEQAAHERLQEHLHPAIPRQARPAPSADARYAQHLIRVARRHGCLDPPKRLHELLADQLGPEWTAERWADAVAEMNEGGGPVHVGRLTETLLARYEVTEPTIRLYDAERKDDAKQRHVAAG